MSRARKKPVIALTVLDREAELYSGFRISNWEQLANIALMRTKGEKSTSYIVRNAIYLGSRVAAIDATKLPAAKSNMALKRFMLSTAFHYGIVVDAISAYVCTHAVGRYLQNSENSPENFRVEQNLYQAFAALVRSGTSIPRYDAFFLAYQEVLSQQPLVSLDRRDPLSGSHLDYNSMTALMCMAERHTKQEYRPPLTPQA